MLIDRQIKPFVISSEESVINALQKMCQSGSRAMLLTSEAGVLEGVFTDGDLRHWLAREKDADLTHPVREAANRQFVSARATCTTEKLATLFTDQVKFVPLLDAQGRLVAIARKDDKHVSIGEFVLDESSPTFVIAEIGNNHNGDIALAKTLVDHAVAAKADCVKFQMRHMKALYRNTSQAQAADEDLGAQYVLDLLNRFQLTDAELFEVFDYCKERGILPMCTPWDLSSLRALEQYGIPAYKVASADLTNHDLLEALARTGKTLVLSTGMSEESEIVEASRLLRGSGAPTILLHCNSTYPAPFHDLNLRYLERLKEISGGLVGYSGHERGYHAVLAAVALGARVIEKHITTDRSLEGNDHKVSLLPGEFADMVRAVREVEQSMGIGGERKPSQGEMINRATLAKSLVVARAIEPGELITDDMVIVRSPGRGLQPNHRRELVGRRAKRAMQAGDFFFPSDLQDDSLDARPYRFRRAWGVPVRYHDYKALLSKTNPDLLEFHLSYRDLDLDFRSFIGREYPDLDLAIHSPELFAGDHVMDLCSLDDAYRNRSVQELQRVIDLTRALKARFPKTARPVIVTNVGGFSLDRPLDPRGDRRTRGPACAQPGATRPRGGGDHPADDAPLPLAHGRPTFPQPLRRSGRHGGTLPGAGPAGLLRRVPLQAGVQPVEAFLPGVRRAGRTVHRAPPRRGLPGRGRRGFADWRGRHGLRGPGARPAASLSRTPRSSPRSGRATRTTGKASGRRWPSSKR